MKSTYNKNNKPMTPEYPYIGVTENEAVLFTSKNTGTLVWIRGTCWEFEKLGYHMCAWEEEAFTPATSPIVLEN